MLASVHLPRMGNFLNGMPGPDHHPSGPSFWQFAAAGGRGRSASRGCFDCAMVGCRIGIGIGAITSPADRAGTAEMSTSLPTSTGLACQRGAVTRGYLTEQAVAYYEERARTGLLLRPRPCSNAPVDLAADAQAVMM